MATECSFDIVSRVDMQEVVNAVNQTLKEISQRYDFRGSKAEIELDKEKAEISLLADDEFKLKSIVDILETKFVKRQLSLKSLKYGKMEPASGGAVKQLVTLQQGISTDRAKEIVKLIKNMKTKVQAEIQSDQVRVKGKSKDDLQTVISMLREREFDYHMEFVNYR